MDRQEREGQPSDQLSQVLQLLTQRLEQVTADQRDSHETMSQHIRLLQENMAALTPPSRNLTPNLPTDRDTPPYNWYRHHRRASGEGQYYQTP